MLDKIREQPQHVREIMFGLSVIITISLVGTVWFGSFRNDLYTLMNPEEVQQQKFLAQNNNTEESLFGALSKTLGDMGAALTGLWGSSTSPSINGTGVETRPVDRVYLLPLSEEK